MPVRKWSDGTLAEYGTLHEDPQCCSALNSLADDGGVLVGLARLEVLDGHAVGFGPLHERLTQELGPVVGSQYLRQSVVALQLLEDAHQAL